MNTIASLEKKLNTIIDTEFEKEQPDDNTVMFCAYALLRMDNTEKYVLTKKEFEESGSGMLPDVKKQSLSKKTKIMLVAAAIIILSLITAIAYGQRDFIIEFFNGHAEIYTEKQSGFLKNELTVNYIPDGFELQKNEKNKNDHLQQYANGEYFFTISKQSDYDIIDVNSENMNAEEITVNNITYIVICNETNGGNILWFDNDMLYILDGNISKDELLKIAKNSC